MVYIHIQHTHMAYIHIQHTHMAYIYIQHTHMAYIHIQHIHMAHRHIQHTHVTLTHIQVVIGGAFFLFFAPQKLHNRNFFKTKSGEVKDRVDGWVCKS
jgi:hypothetical protein